MVSTRTVEVTGAVDRLMGLSEVAAALDVSRRTVDRLIAGRELVRVKIGRRSCVPTSAVVEFIERAKAGGVR